MKVTCYSEYCLEAGSDPGNDAGYSQRSLCLGGHGL